MNTIKCRICSIQLLDHELSMIPIENGIRILCQKCNNESQINNINNEKFKLKKLG